MNPLRDLAFSYAARKVGTGLPVELPGRSGPPDAYTQRVCRMAEQIHGMAPAAQAQVLRILRLKSATVPWSALHPSWLGALMEAWPASWRLWALESLPPGLRGRLQKMFDPPEAPVIVVGTAPSWWNPWFGTYVKTRLDYPDLPPWEKASLLERLPGSLWELDDRDVVVILRFYGTWGLVNCLRKLPRSEAQQLIWRLPVDLQGVAMELAQARKWSDDPFWPAIYAELTEAPADLETCLARMGLADWVRAGLQQEQDVLLRRLAYRLPRSLGQWLLRQMEARPAWVNLPLTPDPERWRQPLVELMQVLHRQGRIHLPTGPKGTAP
jgi:hypothetical protein